MVRNRYISGQVRKSPARLGESEASTCSPSTGVPMRVRPSGDSRVVLDDASMRQP